MDLDDIRLYVDDRPADGVFRLHRDVFSDPELFELEMKLIFERTWIFLGLETQVAKPNDFITTHIGRTPVLLAREAKGGLGAFVNACRHKGATVARVESGNAKFHVCPYHGWAYDAAGKNVDIKDRAAGAYAPAFDAESHDLLPIAKLASYKGLVFGSLSAEVPALEDFLGDMKVFADLAMDQGENGMEFIPGRSAYTFRGNWKLQMDNGTDPYHVTTTHVSMFDLQARRRGGQGNTAARQNDWKKMAALRSGMMIFPRGHVVLWLDQPEPQKRPIYQSIDAVRARVGAARADWMLKPRNTTFFPNMQISEVNALMLRTFRPVSVDLTEMRSWCLAPIGEPAELRAWRLRQFEDFFNPSGFATPDDTVLYGEIQGGMSAHGQSFLQGTARGIGALTKGADEAAAELGVTPDYSVTGGFSLNPEIAFHSTYREWARMIQAGLSGKPAF
jgi:benzoate/toluate 1,2-dioxygenase alpha subunit